MVITLFESILQFVTINPETLVLPENSKFDVENIPLIVFDLNLVISDAEREFMEEEGDSWRTVYDILAGGNGKFPSYTEIMETAGPKLGLFCRTFDKTAKEICAIKGPINYEFLLFPDFRLVDCLKNMPYWVWCMSDFTRSITEAKLNALGLDKCLNGVICIDDNDKGINCKPNEYVFDFLEQLLKIKTKEKVYYFDSNEKSVEVAEKMGWNIIKLEVGNEFLYILNDLKTLIEQGNLSD